MGDKLGEKLRDKMGEIQGEKLNFLMMGKTGQGKSATGNSLLNRKNCFEISCNTTSKTKDVDYNFAEFGRYVLLVIDGPGLEDTDMNKDEDRETAAKNMDKALAMCYGGCVDAFLLVIKFGNKFTAEDKSTLDALKGIFGPSFLNHVIVVISGLDFYRIEMEEEDCESSFPEWCRKQDGAFGQLYKDCKGRCVLFNNKEKNEEKKQSQIRKIVQLTLELRKDGGRYTSQCFQDAEKERNKVVVEAKVPFMKLEIQQTVGLLQAAIENFSKKPSDSEKEKIRTRINDAMKEIKAQDKGTGLLNFLQDLVKKVEENLDDKVKLQRLVQELKDMKKTKTKWTAIGTICTIAGGALCLAATPVAAAIAVGAATVTYGGAGIAVISATTTAIKYKMFSSDESKNLEQQNKIKEKNKK